MSCNCYTCANTADCNCTQTNVEYIYRQSWYCVNLGGLPNTNTPPATYTTNVQVECPEPQCPCEIDCTGEECLIEDDIQDYPATFTYTSERTGTLLEWSPATAESCGASPGSTSGGIGIVDATLYDVIVSYECTCNHTISLTTRSCASGPECSPPPPPPIINPETDCLNGGGF